MWLAKSAGLKFQVARMAQLLGSSTTGPGVWSASL